MGKGRARILGSNAKILVKHPTLQTDIKIGEVDSFTAKSTTSLVKSRPIGQTMEAPNLVNGGWELSFRGGKVDFELARQYHIQESALKGVGFFPTFNIVQEIKYYDGQIETFVYPNSVIYGYELNVDGSKEELIESFSGYSSYRDRFGPNDTFFDTIGTVAGEVIATATKEAIDEIMSELTGSVLKGL